MKVCGLELEGLVKPGEETYYVPIQKITIGILLTCAQEHCDDCETKKCDTCCLKSAIEKAKWSMNADPFFDGDFNVLIPKEKGDENETCN